VASEIWQLPAHKIAAKVRAKELSAVEVTEAYLARAVAVAPEVKAFLEIFDDAPEAAKAVDDCIAGGGDPGVLAGVPVAIKDNMCIRGKVCSCASKILEGFRPPYTATAVERIVAAGGVPIGRTNMDEFAMGSSTENSGYFTTLNPWDTSTVPGGSSGGSAAAVASGSAALAVGSDTGGSIRQPAALCGVVGYKPTYGMVSRYGLVAFGSSLDQIGPFARDVAGAATVMDAISAHDERDATSHRGEYPDYSAAVSAGDLSGKRLGVPAEYFIEGIDPEVETLVRAAIGRAEAAGAELVEISLPHTEYAVAVYYVIATAEASSNLARYDGVHYGHRTENPEGLIPLYSRSRGEGFGAEVKRRIMLGTYALSSGYYDAYYLRALKVRNLIKQDLDAAFEKVDYVVCPTSPTPAFKVGERADDPLAMYLCDIFTISANLAGAPGVSIPCGFTSAGLPVGVQVIGKCFDDAGVLAAAAALERTESFCDRWPEL